MHFWMGDTSELPVSRKHLQMGTNQSAAEMTANCKQTQKKESEKRSGEGSPALLAVGFLPK